MNRSKTKVCEYKTKKQIRLSSEIKNIDALWMKR